MPNEIFEMNPDPSQMEIIKTDFDFDKRIEGYQWIEVQVYFFTVILLVKNWYLIYLDFSI